MTNGFAVNLSWTHVESGSPRDYFVVYRNGIELATVSGASVYRDADVTGGYVHEYAVTTVLVTETESATEADIAVSVPGYPEWESGLSLTLQQNSSQSVSGYATDPLGASLSFSKVDGVSGISVNSAGLVSVGTVAGGNYTLVIRADNGSLHADVTVQVAIIAVNVTPFFTVAPTAASILSSGGTIQFTATDPEGAAVVYSLPTTRSGITINSSTGLVTVASSAAGTTGNIVVRASDGLLETNATCSVTVQTATGYPWPVRSGGPSWPHGTLNLYAGAGLTSTDPWGDLIDWRTWMNHQPDIMGVYVLCNTWTNFESALGNSTAYLYPVIASVPSTAPIILSLSMYPSAQPTVATGGYLNGPLERSGGNRSLPSTGGLDGGPWGTQMWNNFIGGFYDNHYRTMARGLKNLCAGSHGIGSDDLHRSAADFILRLGWEMNGDWYAWSIGNNVAKFKSAWERVVGIIREEIPGIWFDFSPSPAPVRGTSPAVYISGYTPNPNSWNVLSVSHHDAATISGQSSSTVTRSTPSTWTPHETYLNLFWTHAVASGKKMALTEWAAQMANCNATYHVASQDPEWFYIKTWEWLEAHAADIAWDTHFSPGCCSLVTRQATTAAIYYKLKWGA